MHAPFRGLHAIDRVTTSNDEYSISLYWSPERFRIDYPDGQGPFERDPADPAELYMALSVFCRADGRREGLSGPRPLGARLSLPMHPAAPAVYSVLHPMYWVLGLTGREFERVPIVVDLAGVAPSTRSWSAAVSPTDGCGLTSRPICRGRPCSAGSSRARRCGSPSPVTASTSSCGLRARPTSSALRSRCRRTAQRRRDDRRGKDVQAMDNDTLEDLARLHGEATTPVSAHRTRRRLLWTALAALASAVAAYLQR